MSSSDGTEAAVVGDAFVRGVCLALAEVHRLLLHGCEGKGVCQVAAEAGITLTVAKRAGVDRYDLARLRKAGVPK